MRNVTTEADLKKLEKICNSVVDRMIRKDNNLMVDLDLEDDSQQDVRALCPQAKEARPVTLPKTAQAQATEDKKAKLKQKKAAAVRQLEEAGHNKEQVLSIVRQLDAADALPSMTRARLYSAARVLTGDPAGHKPALVSQLKSLL